MISMVIFLKETRVLNPHVLESAASRAWGIDFETGDEARTFVAGESPLFLMRTHQRMYAINHFDQPYFENIGGLDAESIETRVKHIIQHHRSWISIDLIGDDLGLEHAFEYGRIGKLVNQLASENTVAILIPEQMRLIPWDTALKQTLVSNDPVTNLKTTYSPVLQIADDDPKITSGASQARSRWSEFVTAFENHARSELPQSSNEQFSIKAPVSVDGVTEFIWISVTAMENQIIYGTLSNQPVNLNGLSKGDRVRVPVSALNDWIYSQRGQSYGGFTVKILGDLARRHLSQYLTPDDFL